MYKHTDNTFLVCYIPFFSSFTTYRICNKFRKKQDGVALKRLSALGIYVCVLFSKEYTFKIEVCSATRFRSVMSNVAQLFYWG